MIKDIFFSRIIHIKDVFSEETLNHLNDNIQVDKPLEYYKIKYNLDYRTDFFEKDSSTLDLQRVNNEINKKLKNFSYEWNSYEKWWWAVYEEKDWHPPHDHYPIFMRPENFNFGFYYSCVIFLDNKGSTGLLSPNHTSLEKIINIDSDENSILLFPSGLYHYSIPSFHGQRKIYATNGVLNFKREGT